MDIYIFDLLFNYNIRNFGYQIRNFEEKKLIWIIITYVVMRAIFSYTKYFTKLHAILQFHKKRRSLT